MIKYSQIRSWDNLWHHLNDLFHLGQIEKFALIPGRHMCRNYEIVSPRGHFFLKQYRHRFSQRVKNAYRRVEGMDQLRAQHIDHAADKTMSLRGENTLMTAKQLVKVDGEQIHMG